MGSERPIRLARVHPSFQLLNSRQADADANAAARAITKLVLSDLNETGLGCCFESDNYSAIPSSVPAPTAGAGLPSLIFASFGSRLGLSAKRYAGRSFAHSSMSPLIVGDDGGVLGRD